MTTPAAPSTLAPFSGTAAAWLTTAQQQAVTGYPVQETYPGPASEPHGPAATGEPLNRNQQVAGSPGAAYPAQQYQPNLAGGQIPDVAALLGHSAPVADFDSNSGAPFAPPGPVADTHGLDTGGTYRTEHVPPPSSPGWWRRTLSLQTFNRQSFATDAAGWDQNTANNRTDLDQAQGQNANGYNPFTVPYSERPILANFAAEAFPATDLPGGYNPSNPLSPPVQMGGQGNLVYTEPPDPAVNVQPPAVTASASQPQLGMEYLGG